MNFGRFFTILLTFCVKKEKENGFVLQIFHFKRFQSVNDRWVKSCKMVTFPQKDFDPSQYLADANVQSTSTTPVCPENVILDEKNKNSKLTNGPNNVNYSMTNGKISESDEEESSSTSEVEETNCGDTINFVNANGVKKTAVKMNVAKKKSDDDGARRKSESITVLNCGDHNHRLKSDFTDKDLNYDLYAIAVSVVFTLRF